MPKIKKNRRHLLDRRKNDTRKKSSKENVSPLPIPPSNPIPIDLQQPNEGMLQRNHPNSLLPLLYDQLKEQNIDEWTTIISDSSLQLFTVRKETMCQPRIERSVTVCSDLSWHVHVCGRLLNPADSEVFSDLPQCVTDIRSLMTILEQVASALICAGNPDPSFVDLIEREGGSFRGENKEVVATLDDACNVIVSGCRYERTIRTKECEILCRPCSAGEKRVRCHRCSHFRAHLRVKRSRRSNSDPSSSTADSSHTNYSHLSKEELMERLKNVQKSRKVIRRKYKRLAKKVIKEEGVKITEEDENEIRTLMDDVTPELRTKYGEDSPQYVLWQEQKKYNSLQNKRQMRWHPLVIRFALSLFYSSRVAYRTVTSSGFLALPSERTLRDYTHWCSAHSGVQFEYIEQAKKVMSQEGVSEDERHFTLLFDEMKVKGGLVFRKSTGRLVGFCDLGQVNHEIDRLFLSPCEGNAGDHTPQLAKHMLAFMIRPIFRPSLAFTIAAFPTTQLTGYKLFPMVWNVIESLELSDLPVVAMTADGASPNRHFFHLCCLSDDGKKSPIPFVTKNPFAERDVYLFCDPPHLIKTARNCFSNSFAHKMSRELKKNGHTISWKHIEALYLLEADTQTPGVRLCHKLKRDHVWLTSYSKMKVNLAAQVLSESVASALQFMGREDTQETYKFIRTMDVFFDCLNVKNPLESKLKRKDNRAPYRKCNDWRFKWLKRDFLGYLDEWELEIRMMKKLSAAQKKKLCLSKETLEGLRITVNSFCALAPILLKKSGPGRYILSEVFCQDPIERYFSKQRHRGGGNENPTVDQFHSNSAILVQRQQVGSVLRTTNVEPNNSNINHNSAAEPLPKRSRHH